MADQSPALQDEQWLREQYENRQLSTQEIGRLVGVSRQAVAYALSTHGIPMRTGAPVKLRDVGRVRLLVMAREEGSLAALARKLGVGRMTLYAHIARVGLPLDEVQGAAREGRGDQHRQVAKLYRKGLTTGQIGKITGKHPSTIFRVLSAQGVLTPGHRNSATLPERLLAGDPREVAHDLAALKDQGVIVVAWVRGGLYALRAAVYEPPDRDEDGHAVEVGAGTLWLTLEET